MSKDNVLIFRKGNCEVCNDKRLVWEAPVQNGQADWSRRVMQNCPVCGDR